MTLTPEDRLLADRLVARFFRYLAVASQSDVRATTVPSTPGLLALRARGTQHHRHRDSDRRRMDGAVAPLTYPLPVAEPRLGRRTALTLPLLPPPQKN